MTDTVAEPFAPVTFNPFEPGFTDDPYPTYATLRRESPTPFGVCRCVAPR